MVCCQSHVCLLLAIRSSWSIADRTTTRQIRQQPRHCRDTHPYRISVFTDAACTSHNFLTASLICRLFARTSVRNTSVLCSSIFFIADSVFSGETIVRYASIRGACVILFRGYRGERGSRSVFGRRNVTEYRTLRERCPCTPCSAAFLADLALVVSAVRVNRQSNSRLRHALRPHTLARSTLALRRLFLWR